MFASCVIKTFFGVFMTENAQFMLDIDRFIKKAKGREARFVREFAQDLAEEIIQETPVQTGFLRASWAAGINAPDSGHMGQRGTVDSPSDPGGTMGRISLNLSKARPGDTIFISNNAEYAPHVEFGTSKMSPRAFVRRTVARAAQIAENTLRRVVRSG